MNKFTVILTTLFLVACTSVDLTHLTSEKEWYDFGLEQSNKGAVQFSPNKAQTSEENYLAYSDGYQIGQDVYCAQDPHRLGLLRKPYFGICDWSFEQSYQDGLHRGSDKL
ncbi:DUF2799 domain-containing protein [Vibrio tapetis subsp. quintayensis]|uniref:DUF2799 domain-containing protein n=1 Tax=Vibrio tapetis TaxID=52443 RepID=UPI0025B2CDAF|nr:DUF2799 domain-containing protein [Vibrio tapetis]MDN3679968.1 DUF2799 domain-containing protein [Vibrio tapetis subsp. quintayensis]